MGGREQMADRVNENTAGRDLENHNNQVILYIYFVRLN